MEPFSRYATTPADCPPAAGPRRALGRGLFPSEASRPRPTGPRITPIADLGHAVELSSSRCSPYRQTLIGLPIEAACSVGN